jgi:hypothetical protein
MTSETDVQRLIQGIKSLSEISGLERSTVLDLIMNGYRYVEFPGGYSRWTLIARKEEQK